MKTRVAFQLEMAAGSVPVALDWSGRAPFGRMLQPRPRWWGCDFADRVVATIGSPSVRLAPEIYSNGPEFVIVVLDDQSSDGTAAVVRHAAEADPRVRLIPGTPPPPGWTGKNWACLQLAAAAPTADILEFLKS